MPPLNPSLPLRTINPSGSWPFGPATLANCVRTRLKDLHESLASETPRSLFAPRFSAFYGFQPDHRSESANAPFGSLFRLPRSQFAQPAVHAQRGRGRFVLPDSLSFARHNRVAGCASTLRSLPASQTKWMLTARDGLSLTYRDSRSPDLPRQDLCFKPTASPVTTNISSGPFSSALPTSPVSGIGAGLRAKPVAELPACRFLPLLPPLLPLRTINPSGSWPFGPATLASYVRTRLDDLQ
jgi:hypothetical protein